MGISQRPLISSLEFLNKCDLSDPLWTKVLEKVQHIRRRRCSWLCRKENGGHMITRKERTRRILMTSRRVRLERSRRSIEKKVKVLQKLVPKYCESSSSMGLERLFRGTADYIWALEMRVKVMKVLVNVLSPPDINN